MKNETWINQDCAPKHYRKTGHRAPSPAHSMDRPMDGLGLAMALGFMFWLGVVVGMMWMVLT